MYITLQDLRAALQPLAAGELFPAADGSICVTSLCFDSRRAQAGTVFFCLPGAKVDGHDFATAAYARGCRLFVAERALDLPGDAHVALVTHARSALADGAAAFYGHPEREVRLVGLTGTKGKTTTAVILHRLLTAGGIPTGYIGTNGADFGNHHEPTANSTPESLELYRLLREMANAGMVACVLEVSSQALWMGRTRGLCFDTTVFTNLARDHIGGVEHPDMAHYAASKRSLFADYPAACVVVNADDEAAGYMTEAVDASRTAVVSVSLAPDDGEGFRARDICHLRREGRIGMGFSCVQDGKTLLEEWFLPMTGDFNVRNALAALAVACGRFGVSPAGARAALADVQVAGRLETVIHPAYPDVTFVIDYAHNGVSLAAVLDALRATHPGRLIALFGSVGGRTKERRGDLARAAAERCDLCILTSDNPADEPPMQILAEIDAAFPAGACPRVLIPDRAEAIRYAVEACRPGDIILLAGKGHEDYQLIGEEKIPFSEREILAEALEERAGAGVV